MTHSTVEEQLARARTGLEKVGKLFPFVMLAQAGLLFQLQGAIEAGMANGDTMDPDSEFGKTAREQAHMFASSIAQLAACGLAVTALEEKIASGQDEDGNAKAELDEILGELVTYSQTNLVQQLEKMTTEEERQNLPILLAQAIDFVLRQPTRSDSQVMATLASAPAGETIH